MRSANERRRYNVTSSLIGGAIRHKLIIEYVCETHYTKNPKFGMALTMINYDDDNNHKIITYL